MLHPPTWTIEARCEDRSHPPLTVKIAANSALEALASMVAELVATPRAVAAAASPRQLDATWPDCVSVIACPSTTHGDQFSVKCRCGADWGTQDRRRSLLVLRETIPNHHGPGRCEDRWPENRSPAESEPANTVGAEIRQRRTAAGLSQAQLAEAVGVSPATISTAERVMGGVSGNTIGRIRTALEEVEA